VGEQGGDGVGGGGHVRVAEHHEHGLGRDRDEVHGGGGDHAQRALAAREHPGQVGAVLGEQVLEGVPGDLPLEPPELRADGGEVRVHQVTQPRDHREVTGRVDRPARAVEDVEGDDVVGRPPVGDGPWPAGVVADHPAERGPGPRRGVRAEPEAVRCGRVLERRHHHAGLDDGGARLRVEGVDAVHVAAEVEHQAGPDGVARHRGARPAGGEGHAVLPGHLEAGGDVGRVPRVGDHLGDHPVVRGVGRVLGTAPVRVVHLAPQGGTEVGNEASQRRRHASQSRTPAAVEGPASRYPARRGSANGQPAQPSGRRAVVPQSVHAAARGSSMRPARW